MSPNHLKQAFMRDFHRVFWPMVIAVLFVTYGVDFAVAVGHPEIAPWGTFTGAAIYTAVVVHFLRRIMFPKLDLQLIAKHATDTPTGAGLVVLGLCLVTSAFALMAGAMLRS